MCNDIYSAENNTNSADIAIQSDIALEKEIQELENLSKKELIKLIIDYRKSIKLCAVNIKEKNHIAQVARQLAYNLNKKLGEVEDELRIVKEKLIQHEGANDNVKNKF